MSTATTLPGRNGRPNGAPIFLLAILIGIGAHVGLLGLFHFTIGQPPSPAPRAPAVQFFQSADPTQAEAMRQEAMFSDPRILYTISPANFGQRAAPPSASGLKPAFDPYALDLANKVGGDMKNLAQTTAPTVTPSEVLQSSDWNVLHTIGGAANSSPALQRRGAQLRIELIENGPGPSRPVADRVTEVTWPLEMAPDAGVAIWSPATFLLSVKAAGTIDSSSLKISSGVKKVDGDLEAKLKAWLQSHPPKPGYYLIQIGP